MKVTGMILGGWRGVRQDLKVSVRGCVYDGSDSVFWVDSR